ncbi:MAG: hypothetical protein KDC38_20210, partial [Planctomycetes bacterium]|nr:hypothetical protein [Planctomycetota bacterium]
MRRAPIRSGMTLLEAVLALAILSSVLIVCLELRARMIRHTDALQRSQMVERETQNLFLMASTRSLPDPRVDKENERYIWEGEHLGSPYTITAKIEQLPAPTTTDQPDAEARTVTMWRYDLSYMG